MHIGKFPFSLSTEVDLIEKKGNFLEFGANYLLLKYLRVESFSAFERHFWEFNQSRKGQKRRKQKSFLEILDNKKIVS